MSKTIEERANSTAQWIIRREGCLKAANLPQLLVGELQEQCKIDIEKACEWLKENIYNYIAVGNTDFGKPYDIDLVADELFEDFIKAMEEEQEYITPEEVFEELMKEQNDRKQNND